MARSTLGNEKGITMKSSGEPWRSRRLRHSPGKSALPRGHETKEDEKPNQQKRGLVGGKKACEKYKGKMGESS